MLTEFLPARMAFWAAALFLLILASLHIIKPGVDPSWNFISEYQVGDYGWLMSVAFFTMGLSCVFLVVTLWKYLRSFVGILGMFMLLLTAAGMMVAAFNPTDPINTRPELMTPQGELHQWGAMLDQIPFAAVLISIVLIRKHDYWKSKRARLISATVVVWVGLIVFIAFMSMYMPVDGVFGAHTPLGWPNRFMISVQALWVMVVAWLAYRGGGIQ